MGIVYPLGGKLYDLLDEHYEKSRYAKIRKHMLGNLGNTILDAGCGTGRNFQYFSPNAKINGVDLSPKMLEAAKKRAQNAKIPIKLERMNLTNLHFKDNLFDNVVATFVLCVLPKKYEQQALKELIRVAKPGAKLHFLEYVYSQDPVRNLTMKATSFIPKLLYSIRFGSTFPLLEKEDQLKIEKVSFVHDDVIRLIVGRKL